MELEGGGKIEPCASFNEIRQKDEKATTNECAIGPRRGREG